MASAVPRDQGFDRTLPLHPSGWNARRRMLELANCSGSKEASDVSDHEQKTETLDPNDPTELRALAHRMVDDAFDDLASVRDRPAWQPMPASAEERFRSPVPRKGEGAEAAYRAYREWIAPFPMGNTHPRFWGWYMVGWVTSTGVAPSGPWPI